MANSFPAPVTAAQVGSYFVTQYYHVLQQQPDYVHQFYTDASTMIRVDGDKIESAAAMLQIHSLIMSLNFTGIEIKTAHSLESWTGGVVVMVSGSVQTRDLQGRRKFVQTFFLAPQEKGYFVLNDIFQLLDNEEQIFQHPEAMVVHEKFDSQLHATNPVPVLESVSDYMLGGEVQKREFLVPNHMQRNSGVDDYGLPEQPQVSEANSLVEEPPADDSTNATFSSPANTVQDPSPAQLEEMAGEPSKQTYASILRVAKGPAVPVVAPQSSLNKGAAVGGEWYHMPQPTALQSHPAASMALEKNSPEASEEITMVEEEGEGKSVYVRNLPSTVSVSDVENEFKAFGRIKPDGVVVRNRKDIGVCYAFIEYDDTIAVQNAIKASPIQFGGRQLHVEERRPSSSASRGGRRGRGRGGYHMDAGRGRGHFGSRYFGRGSGQDGDYSNRPRGNGFHQRGPRQDTGITGNQASRDGLSLSESTE